MMEGAGTTQTHLAAEGFQEPGLEKRVVDTSGCASLRSSHLHVISLRALKKRAMWIMDSDVSVAKAGLQYRASSSDSFLYLVHRRAGGAAGAFTTHVDDILGCGGQDVLPKTQTLPEARLG